MSIAAAMLPEFDQEMANTRKTLERVPEDKFDWLPISLLPRLTVRYATAQDGTQGWGAADMQKMYDLRDKTIFVDQSEVIDNLETISFDMTVAATVFFGNRRRPSMSRASTARTASPSRTRPRSSAKSARPS